VCVEKVKRMRSCGYFRRSQNNDENFQYFNLLVPVLRRLSGKPAPVRPLLRQNSANPDAALEILQIRTHGSRPATTGWGDSGNTCLITSHKDVFSALV
jgi:hypothetical protein